MIAPDEEPSFPEKHATPWPARRIGRSRRALVDVT